MALRNCDASVSSVLNRKGIIILYVGIPINYYNMYTVH